MLRCAPASVSWIGYLVSCHQRHQPCLPDCLLSTRLWAQIRTLHRLVPFYPTRLGNWFFFPSCNTGRQVLQRADKVTTATRAAPPDSNAIVLLRDQSAKNAERVLHGMSVSQHYLHQGQVNSTAVECTSRLLNSSACSLVPMMVQLLNWPLLDTSMKSTPTSSYTCAREQMVPDTSVIHLKPHHANHT